MSKAVTVNVRLHSNDTPKTFDVVDELEDVTINHGVLFITHSDGVTTGFPLTSVDQFSIIPKKDT